MKKIYFENGSKIIEADGIGFIIPNNGDHSDNFRDWIQKWYMPIVETNKISLEKNDYIVQVWSASEEDLDSDNLERHGFTITEDGKRIHYSPRMELLPASMFEGKVEGDTVTFDVPIHGFDEEGELDDEVIVTLRFNMKLCQREYRYRNFGNFEEVLKRVCR